MSPVKRAVAVLGSNKALADAIDVAPALVSQWVNKLRDVPATRCLAIERATNGAVTRYELREDVFGTAPESTKAGEAA